MTPEEQVHAQIGINFLHQFVLEASAFFFECQENPKPRSVVARAKRSPDLVQILDATLVHDAASDHFKTIVNEFVNGPLPRFSPYTVVRSALEADAWVCWMLEPSLDDTERLGRALTLRSKSLFEMKRLGLPPKKRLPPRTTSTSHYNKRMKRVLASGKRWKLAAKTDKNGLVTFVGVPHVTPLLRSLLPEDFAKNRKLTVGDQVYGELSARAHGTTWSLLSNITRVARLNQFQQLGYSELDVVEFIRLLGVAIHLHDRATTTMAALAGIEPDVWPDRRGDIPWIVNGGELIIPH